MPVRKNSMSMFGRGLNQDEEPPGPLGINRGERPGGVTSGTGGGGGTSGGGGGSTGGGGGGMGGGGGRGGGGGGGGRTGPGPGGGGGLGNIEESSTGADSARDLERERRQDGGSPGLVGSMLAAMSRSQPQQPSAQTMSQTPRIEPEGFPLVGSAEISEKLPEARSTMPSMSSRGPTPSMGGAGGLITGEPGVLLSGLDPSQAGTGLTGGGLGLQGGAAGTETDALRKMLLELLGKGG